MGHFFGNSAKSEIFSDRKEYSPKKNFLKYQRIAKFEILVRHSRRMDPVRRWNRIQFDVHKDSSLAIASRSGSVAANQHDSDHHEEHHTGTCGYHKQNWNEVDHVAWVLLLTIAIECFIEGIAFSLALQDSFGAGVAVFLAMLIKLVPQKMGHVGFLLSAGLNHFWENVLALLAVMMIYVGIILGLAIENQLREIKYYFFGALSGIFLYMSLASLFPVLQEAIEDHTVDPEGILNVNSVLDITSIQIQMKKSI